MPQFHTHMDSKNINIPAHGARKLTQAGTYPRPSRYAPGQ